MKDKIVIKVADVPLTLVTDESVDFVKSVAKDLDEKIRLLIGKNNKYSKYDSAVLCAMEYCSEKIQADKEIGRLEDRISLFEMGDKVNKEEISRLRAKCETLSAEIDKFRFPNGIAAAVPAAAGDADEEVAIEAIEIQPQMSMFEADAVTDEGESDDAAESELTAEESRQKLAEIERLLKSN